MIRLGLPFPSSFFLLEELSGTYFLSVCSGRKKEKTGEGLPARVFPKLQKRLSREQAMWSKNFKAGKKQNAPV